MTDCLDVRELLEIATVEPGGLDRLVAGDTPDSARAASHLAACPPCSEELMRLQRTDAILRPILSAMPAPDLRDRVLARVAAVGIERSGVHPAVPTASAVPAALGVPAVLGVPAALGVPAEPKGAPTSKSPTVATMPASISAASTAPASGAQASIAGRRRAWWPAAVAAALAIGLVGGIGLGRLVAGAPAPAPAPTTPDVSSTNESAAALSAVSRETANLMAAPDARTVALRDMSGKPAGSLVVAQSVGRIVVTALDLPVPAANMEYRCWVEANGTRATLGEMWFAADVAWWSGPAKVPAGDVTAMKFGVSLVSTAPAGSGPAPAPVAVLLGP